MIKITGNEPVYPCEVERTHPEFGTLHYPTEGIPIRLHIAAMIAQWLAAKPECPGHDLLNTPEYPLQIADALISAYNNTPNPNE
jgi:hypothetical protein